MVLYTRVIYSGYSHVISKNFSIYKLMKDIKDSE